MFIAATAGRRRRIPGLTPVARDVLNQGPRDEHLGAERSGACVRACAFSPVHRFILGSRSLQAAFQGLDRRTIGPGSRIQARRTIEGAADAEGTASRHGGRGRRRTQAVEELKAAKEASAVSDLSGAFDRPEAWSSVAYLSMYQRTGSATTIRILHPSWTQCACHRSRSRTDPRGG